ncbi:histidine kinase [Micromonospora olivasterospora]|uniref:histidine kinase n=1 Tax=Micromonospora olivasterospora TaxID=1880 RepID=A0A562IJB7_MICOL|nr:sensor histidine kinase [Micromonospora olivasterospora]TWH71030.1 histidine kinase [Micromonospora olivasterospora]
MTTGRLPRRWRTLLVLASVAATVPVLACPASPLTLTAALVLTVAQAAALWWLDRHPRRGTAVVLLASAGLQLMFPLFGPNIAFVVLCTHAWLRPAAETLWILGFAVVCVGGPAVLHGGWTTAALWVGAVLLAWSWGALARARGERRVAERRQVVLEERARIARDLHDVLAHTVSVMVVQAAAADDVFESDPQRAREALRRTEEAGRQALTELRGFLRTVRADDEADEGPDRGAPQPTLADLPRLIEMMGATGLRVALMCDGDGEVPLGVQVGAYRIVQEALTNTLRHAGASAAEVLVRVDESEVRVRITDDGRGPAGGCGSGHGLVGMRERASLLGGTLQAGPRPGCAGFEVQARLPVRETS